MRIVIATALAMLFCVVGTTPAQDDTSDWEYAFSEASPELVSLRAKIIAEAASAPANEWSGRYIADAVDNSYSSLLWALNSGFLLYRHMDAGVPFYVAVGRATLDDRTLHLIPSGRIENLETYAYSSEFRCIRWGDAHYLIPPTDLREFCLAVNSTSEEEVGRFLRKVGDLEKRNAQFPTVPAKYVPYLHIPPITARVLHSRRVSSVDNMHVRVTLDAGTSRGVQSGMAFWQSDPRSQCRIRLRVVSVSRGRSEAQLEAIVGPLDDKEYLPRKGVALCNRPTEVDRKDQGVARGESRTKTCALGLALVEVGTTQPN